VFFQAWTLAMGKHSRHQPALSLDFVKYPKWMTLEKCVNVSNIDCKY